MNQWSRNRKRIILAILFFALVVLVGVPLFFLFYQKPSCTDNKQNGDETGVDCGGSCQRLCTAESLPLILKGDPRVLRVAESVYEVVALVENPNQNAEVYKANYTLKLYDPSSSISVKVIEGSTFIPRGSVFALFEGPFTLEAGVVPNRATLEWHLDALSWQKSDQSLSNLEVSNTTLTQASTTPRLEAEIRNLSLESVSNIDLVALITDTNGNIFAASKTFVDSLASNATTPIIFTWPRPFTSSAVGIQIIKRVFPDRSFIR